MNTLCLTKPLLYSSSALRPHTAQNFTIKKLIIKKPNLRAFSKNSYPSVATMAQSTSNTSSPLISSSFESGNIQLVDISTDSGTTTTVNLNIKEEPICQSDGRAHYQWFHFRCSNAKNQPLQFQILNAGGASFSPAWHGYNVCATTNTFTSTDAEWFRIPSSYNKDTGILSWSVTPTTDVIYFAYFAPYSSERRRGLLSQLQHLPGVELETLGLTLDGQEIDMVKVGDLHTNTRNNNNNNTVTKKKKQVWIVARQHPGETQAEFFTEGLLLRLTDVNDPTSRALRAAADFYIVPCMCPDGASRGHLRTNGAGANLNREWQEPSMTASPEVYVVRNKMDETGVDLMIDAHGDEALPFVFFAGNEGIPSWDARLKGLQDAFYAAFLAASPDFQTERGYGIGAPGRANLKLGSKQAGERWKCLAVTLEMPFKDCGSGEREVGAVVDWNEKRCVALGRDMLTAIMAVVDTLR